MFVASVVVGLGAGGFWAYSYFSEQSAAKDVAAELKTAGISHGKLSQSDCSNSMLTGGSASLSDACKFHDWTTYGIVGTVAAVALVGVTGYMAFGRGSSESPTKTGTTTSRGRVRKPEFSITPVVQANGGGATFRLDW